MKPNSDNKNRPAEEQSGTELSVSSTPKPIAVALLFSVFVVAACGLLYELAAGAIASYVLGDSILQFSTIIGAYLFAMGIGAWLSRYFDRQLPAHFLRIELLVALVGGLMPTVLFLTHAYIPTSFRLVLYALVLLVGTLVGLEIPLVMRILKRHTQFKHVVSQVLSVDYLGALAVSVAFPLLLVPQLGLIRTGLVFGFFNASVALWALWLFRHELRGFKAHLLATLSVMTLLLAGLAQADRITTLSEDKHYQDRIIARETSPFQKLVVTHGKLGHKLYINGNLQFAQSDEYRYHEALVHPAMLAHGAPKRIAVLGGGDGMAVREVLKYPSVEHITLVDLDPAMTRLFSTTPALQKLNAHALSHPKVRIINTDAFKFLETADETFDVIVVDFPDPSNYHLGKLYTHSFYALLDTRLAASGYAVVQSTSPLVARESFWTVVTTLEAAGLQTAPYHAQVPSFGEWGFVLASRRPVSSADLPRRAALKLPADLKFLTPGTLPYLFEFPADMARLPAQVNRLSNQVLVSTFEREWGKVLP